MTYESKNYDLNSIPKDWGNEDFAWVIEQLETMPKEKLFSLCNFSEIELRFPGSVLEDVPVDEILNALIADFTPDILIPAIKKLD